MRIRALTLLVCLVWAAPAVAFAEPLTGRWLLGGDFLGVPRYFVVNFVEKDGALTGDFDGDPLTGTVRGAEVRFAGVDPRGGHEEITGTLADGALSGTLVIVFTGGDPKQPQTVPFAASRVAVRKGPPRALSFAPTAFHREFSPSIAPVLHIFPGDSVSTWTVDAGGFDAKNVHRSAGGNPQTGPFYVDGAVPGDLLAVKIVKLRPNRGTALSTNGLVERALGSDLAPSYQNIDQVTWKLDLARGLAMPPPGDHLARYAVPMRPMLGCVATAPPPGRPGVPTGDSGSFGGNLDFNEVVEGSTVYLPVRAPGALLYLGDAHAAQGDGELTGDALETSMDVTFSVDVVSGKAPPAPRVETATHLAALGYAGSLDDAFRAATANMSAWLKERYSLSAAEIAEVLGTSAEYRIAEVADRNAGIALMLAKSRLSTVTRIRP